MVKKTVVHGFPLVYEEKAKAGMEYLRDDLDAAEARVFFDGARARGSAPFEDDDDRQFTLVCQRGAFTLLKR